MIIITMLSLLLIFPSFSGAASFTASNLPSDRTFISFLQFTNEDKSLVVSFFTNRFFTDGRTVTHDIDFVGEFSVFNIELQERFFISDKNHFLVDGSTYRHRATIDRPFEDFVFTISGDGLADTQLASVPEPSTIVLFATGILSLVGYRKFMSKEENRW